MQRFKKAIALLFLIFFIVYSAVSVFIKKYDPLVREKIFDDYNVNLIIDKEPIVNETMNFGYYFEYLNKTEAKDMFYNFGEEIEIKSNNITVSNPKDFVAYFKRKPKNDITKTLGYSFKEPGLHTVISRFEQYNKTITTEFLINVKTKQEVEEQKIKGSLITVISFLLVAIFAIYLYEKLEKPRSKK